MKRKLGLFVVSAVMLGGIYSPAPAAEIDCNSLLTQLAINSLEEDSSSVPLMYAHCVPGALRPTPAFEGMAFDEQRLMIRQQAKCLTGLHLPAQIDLQLLNFVHRE